MLLNTFRTSFLFTFLLIALNVLQVKAGTIDKAFEALEMKDYFKARDLFEKVERSDKLAGNFGLCLVHVARQNPFYNLDSAQVYAMRAESFWRSASDKDKKKLAPYGISDKGVQGLRVMVYMYATDEAKQARTIEACDSFLKRFSSAPQKRKFSI